jgi:hypothetical protein
VQNNSGLPTGRKFGRITQSGLVKRSERQEKSAAEFGVDFPKKGRKGAEFLNLLLPLFFSYEKPNLLKTSNRILF